MKNIDFNKGKNACIFWLVLGNIAAVALMLGFSICTMTDTVNLMVNIGCAIVMEIIIVIGSVSMFNLQILYLDLSQVAEQLKNLDEYCQDGSENEVKIPQIAFSTEILKGKFGEYKNEYNRLNKEYPDTKKCDINDYFNYELLECSTISITNLIPGILTALGIAGTFIGLMFGLSNFNINDVDIVQTQNSISQLLNGIKTAFLTSIFGVVLSLFFNFFYHIIYRKSEKGLDEFIVSFEKIVPSVTNSVINEITSFNHIQSNLMEKYSEIMAEKISGALIPIVSGFEETTKELKEHIIETQDESLGKIVDSFVNSMNQSLGNQFDELSNTLEVLNKNQIKNAEKLQISIDSVCTSADKIAEVNNLLNSSLDNLREYTSQINDYQIFITKSTEDLHNTVSNVLTVFESQGALIEKLEQEQLMTSENINKLKEFINITNEMSQKQLSSIEQIIEGNKEIIKQQSQSTEDYLSSVLNSVDVILQNSNERDQKLLTMYQTIVEHSEEILNSSITQTKDIKIMLNNSVNESFNNIKRSFTELDNNIERMLKNTFATFDTSLTDIANTVSGTVLNTRENIDKLNHTTENIPEMVYQIYDNMSKSIVKHIDAGFKEAFKDQEPISDGLKAFNHTLTLMCSEMAQTNQALAELRNKVQAVKES